MAHANVEVIRQVYEAAMKKDLEAAGNLLAPGVIWHEAGGHDPIVGRDAVLERLTAGGLEPDIDVHDIVAGDEHAVSIIRVHVRKPDGDDISYPAVEVAHIADGMVTERWAFMDAVPADVQEFFAGLG